MVCVRDEESIRTVNIQLNAVDEWSSAGHRGDAVYPSAVITCSRNVVERRQFSPSHQSTKSRLAGTSRHAHPVSKYHLSGDVTPRVEPHVEAWRRISAQRQTAHLARLVLGQRRAEAGLRRRYDVATAM